MSRRSLRLSDPLCSRMSLIGSDRSTGGSSRGGVGEGDGVVLDALMCGAEDQQTTVARRSQLVGAQQCSVGTRQIVAGPEQPVRLADRRRQAYAQPRLGRVEFGVGHAIAVADRSQPGGREVTDESPGRCAVVQRLDPAHYVEPHPMKIAVIPPAPGRPRRRPGSSGR